MNRRIKHVLKSKVTMEGAGVRLKRVFGYDEVPLFDPLLLFDHFGSEDPEDYVKGFPWHPHRGIEMVTYMLDGEVEHGDSMGNKGVNRSGDLQWMTAGSGIIHQEMPKEYLGLMRGFQLCVNLPGKKTMMVRKYRGITKHQIPSLKREGAEIKIIAGEIDGVEGPVQDLAVEVEYFDVTLATGKTFQCASEKGFTAFMYLIEGLCYVEDKLIEPERCVLFSDDGDSVLVRTGRGVRFLLVQGKPLGEPVAWGGPIVMNTEEELAKAFEELEEGEFIKDGRTVKPSKDFYRG